MYIYIFIIIVLSIVIFYKFRKRETFIDYNSNIKFIFKKKLLSLIKRLKLKLNENGYYNFIITNRNHKKLNIEFFKIINPNKKILINRFITINLLVDNNIPIPKCNFFSTISNTNNLRLIMQNMLLDYPIVVKTNSNKYNDAMFVNVNNNNELKNILTYYLKNNYNDSLLVQKFIPGKKYRILCYRNKIIDVIRLLTPYIIGDGTSNIQELIDYYNHKIPYINPVSINSYCLKKHSYTQNTILPKNKLLVFNNIVSTRSCNDIKRIQIEKVHPDNILIFKKINNIIDLELFSIDFISENIGISFLKNKAKVIGLNPNPNIEPYFLANKKFSLKFMKRLLESYYNL